MIVGPGSAVTPEVVDALDALVNAKIKMGTPPYRIPLPSCSDVEYKSLADRCRQAGWAAGLIRHEGVMYVTLSTPSKSEEERG